MVSMAGDAVNVYDAGFVTPAFWKSSADGAEQTAPCASHQEWLQHMPRTSHHPCHTLGKGGTAVSDNWASLAGPESSPDGRCHMFISSHGFQAIRVINHNWKKKKATINSIFPSSLSKYLRKKVHAVKRCFGQDFSFVQKGWSTQNKEQTQKIKVKFCADSLSLTGIIKFQTLRLWPLLWTW